MFLLSRFFADKEQFSSDFVTLLGDDVKHISKVLRMRAGDEITLCDKCGTDYRCSIREIYSDKIIADILSKEPNKAEAPINITLYQGLPKSDKMEYIIQKCVELGVNNIVPVMTKRVISKPKDMDKKIDRWQKIATEASKQCGRGVIPKVHSLILFEDMAKSISEAQDLNLMPYECEKNCKIKDILKNNKNTNINIIIGPEGGFDDTEAMFALNNNITTVTLGPRILRTETAPIATVSAIMYELGDW